ncbi:MAG: hypothetical protein FJY82_14105 [Candidatus Aminicenantes bacterium]|nr:hypothetical protein [Candidatus Aminicenantes bacterium]
MIKSVGRRRSVAAALVLAGGVSAAAGSDRQGTIAFSYGRYEVADARFKTIYPDQGPAWGFTLTAALFAPLEASLEIKHLSRTGTLSFTKEATRFHLVPISFGLRLVAPGKIFQPFAGGGLNYNLYYEDNPIGTTADAARGVHLQAGLYFRFGARFPILLLGQVKYVWAKVEKDGRTIDLGGLEYHGGLALAF